MVLLAFGAFGIASADVKNDDTSTGGCPALDADTIDNLACIGVVNLSDSNLHDLDNSCWDAVPSGLATTGAGVIANGAVLAHTINDVVPICFQHQAGTSNTVAPIYTTPIAFDANDVGRWLAVICAQGAAGLGSGADYEFTTSSLLTNTAFDGPDECTGTTGKGTDLIVVPDQSPGYLAFYQCPPVNAIANITITHEQELFSFSITCIGPAAQATIGVSPSTVEIVPAPGNQSYSRVTVTVADALGNRIDGVEVDFITDNCWWRGEVASQDFGTVSPRGGLDANVRTHVSFSDTDVGNSSNEEGEGSAQDGAYINTVLGQVTGSLGVFNPTTGVPVAAGTAESVLQCFPGTDTALAALVKPGPANIQAIVRRTGTPGLCPINNTGIAATATNSLSGLTSSSYAECGALFGFPLNFSRNSPFLPFGYEDIILTATVTVIGPPASITVAASPTSLRCGEKSTITATIKDALGANVSDHTRVELITNLGGVLAGTGAVTSGLGAGVTPISSTVAETFAGVATAFLLTSEVTTGPYEVVVTAGGSFPVNFGLFIPSQTSFTQSSTANAIPGPFTYVGGGGDVSPISGIQEPGTVGVFSTAPVSAQATVTCALPTPAAPPAPQVTAPRTGTGITPPNTGDAGLADASGNSFSLLALGSLVALAIAGVVTLKAVRR